MITMTLGWGVFAALIAWSAFVFWLGRASAGNRGRGDLSGLPPSLATPRAALPAGRKAADLSSDQLAAVRSELARGNKIAAIKLMREATGLGLAEAKDAVEAMGG